MQWLKRRAIIRTVTSPSKIIKVYECAKCGSIYPRKDMEPNKTKYLCCHLRGE